MGFLMATDEMCKMIADHIVETDCRCHVVLCSELYDQIISNVNVQLTAPIIQYTFIERFKRKNKLTFFAEELDTSHGKCSPNDNDDEMLINCAVHGQCDMIVTKDTRLALSNPCNIELVLWTDFLDNHAC